MNTTKYLKALENSIHKLHQLPASDPMQSFQVVAELCDVLRLGKVEAVVFENEAPDQSTTNCMFDSGKAAQTNCFSKRVVAPDDMVIIYNIYPIEGDEAWTEEDRGRLDVFVSLLSTISGKARLVDLAQRVAFYDSELGMYNLRQFMRCAKKLGMSRQIDQYTVVRFNLKHFSVVNQNIGRENGTLVMKEFVMRVDGLLDGENELVCRVGGDNFLTLIKNDKLQAVLDILNGTDIVYNKDSGDHVFISATTGVYKVRNADGRLLPTDIMDRVSLAFHAAKGSSQTDVVFFDNELLVRSKHDNDISAGFPQALKDGEFLVYYQPKVSIDGGRIAGAEALCRWMHEGKLVPPMEFIPVLEQGLDICKLDFYMLDRVCKDIRRWLDSGKHAVRISVNFSRRHLSDMDLLEHILEIVDRNQVPHEYIEIELTETTSDVEFKDLKRVIRGLQQSGLSTSVDDFGVGYSSLNLIKEIPWNVLKLDRTLLPGQGGDDPIQRGVMFKYVVAMAQEKGLECIAEGVETAAQVQLLAANNCKLAQGFYFDKPLPVEVFETRFDKQYT